MSLIDRTSAVRYVELYKMTLEAGSSAAHSHGHVRW
jgi:hypothetical protein